MLGNEVEERKRRCSRLWRSGGMIALLRRDLRPCAALGFTRHSLLTTLSTLVGAWSSAGRFRITRAQMIQSLLQYGAYFVGNPRLRRQPPKALEHRAVSQIADRRVKTRCR